MEPQLAQGLTRAESGAVRRWPAAGDGPLIGLICLVLAVGLILWFDNVHLETTNGLWKSMDVAAWKANYRTAELRAPNYLYYPTMALFGQLLDGQSAVFRGYGRVRLGSNSGHFFDDSNLVIESQRHSISPNA